MTPKEKAKELVNWYYENLPQWVNMSDAKMCAIKAVDELIADYKSFRVKSYLTLESALDLCEYLNDVKKEIELL